MELHIKGLSPRDLQDLITMFPEITNHGTVKNDSTHDIDIYHETGILELILVVSPAIISMAGEIIRYIKESKQKSEGKTPNVIYNNCTFIVNNYSEINSEMENLLKVSKDE